MRVAGDSEGRSRDDEERWWVWAELWAVSVLSTHTTFLGEVLLHQ